MKEKIHESWLFKILTISCVGILAFYFLTLLLERVIGWTPYIERFWV